MMSNLTVFFGSPGTGKTTTLLNCVDTELGKGIPYIEIGYMAYTRAARREAIERAFKRGADPRDLMWFRTIHSTCSRLLGLHHKNFVKNKHKKAYCDLWKVEYEYETEEYSKIEDYMTLDIPSATGNNLFKFREWYIHNICKTISSSESEEVNRIFDTYFLPFIESSGVSPIIFSGINIYNFLKGWEKFLEINNLYDYSRVVIEAYNQKLVPPCSVLIVDEFQDLYPLLYEIVKMWKNEIENIYIAGDDDQCIFSWAGSDPEFLLEMARKADDVKVLPISWRLPENILKFAMNFISQNKERWPKKVVSMNSGGIIKRIYPSEVIGEIMNGLKKDKKILILARTNRIIEEWKKTLTDVGIIPFWSTGKGFTWTEQMCMVWNSLFSLKHATSPENWWKNLPPENRKYLTTIIRARTLLLPNIKTQAKKGFAPSQEPSDVWKPNGLEIFTKSPLDYLEIKSEYFNNLIHTRYPYKYISWPPKIEIGTIHTNKGRESDWVFLDLRLPRIIERQISESLMFLESERRVFFVGMTRAREALYLIGSNIIL
jgi:DNA helicase-2/ATP-dependent DNA helicase PcrA